jgi:hypothetical protein
MPRNVGRIPTIPKEKVGKGCRIGFTKSDAKNVDRTQIVEMFATHRNARPVEPFYKEEEEEEEEEEKKKKKLK